MSPIGTLFALTWATYIGCKRFSRALRGQAVLIQSSEAEARTLVTGLQDFEVPNDALPLQDVIDSCAQAAMDFLQKSNGTIPDLDNTGAHTCVATQLQGALPFSDFSFSWWHQRSKPSCLIISCCVS